MFLRLAFNSSFDTLDRLNTFETFDTYPFKFRGWPPSSFVENQCKDKM